MFKKIIFNLLLISISVSGVLSSEFANAYDVDTHFYGTYSMARFAGIRHEVAMKIALGAQWMDESYISDPLSMIILPETGMKKRRLLHFPGTRLANKLTIDKAPKWVTGDGPELKMETETEADDLFATEMFTEGLKEGNLMKAATGLHTLEDSFAHAGTISELGHAHFWHNPDRPYVNQESVDKYFEMSLSVLRAIVAIRMSLPENAIDQSVRFGARPNCELSGDELNQIYSKLPIVVNTISYDLLRDKEFVDYALKIVFELAYKANYIKNGYQTFLGQYKPGSNTYEAAAQIALAAFDYLNVQEIAFGVGWIKDIKLPLQPHFVKTMGGAEGLINKGLIQLLSSRIPRGMTEKHKFEKEEDGKIRDKEMELRELNMRRMIRTMYGTNIYFMPNQTSSESGFMSEITGSQLAEPRLPDYQPGLEIATYRAHEKTEFDKNIFQYIFPKLSEYLGSDLGTAAGVLASLSSKIKNNTSSDPSMIHNWTIDLGNMIKMAWHRREPFYANKIAEIAKTDILTSRLNPSQDNRVYTDIEITREFLRTKKFKVLLSSDYVNLLVRVNEDFQQRRQGYLRIP